MKTLEQEALLRLLQKHHIRELENIMADIATLTIKPTTITWNCGLGSIIITTEKAQEILNERSQTLEQAADKMESKHTEVWVEGRTIFEQEQKSAEWSEEDLQHKSWILECLADGERKMPEYAEDFRAAYKWLKSLHPQPHWKPSEEQMEELNKVRTLNPGLDALYQQLKNM